MSCAIFIWDCRLSFVGVMDSSEKLPGRWKVWHLDIFGTPAWFIQRILGYFSEINSIFPSTLPSKGNTTLGSGAQLWGQKILKGVVSMAQGKLPLLITFWPLGVNNPKLESWGLLNQVLRFFWRGVYNWLNVFQSVAAEAWLLGAKLRVLPDCSKLFCVGEDQRFTKKFDLFFRFYRSLVYFCKKLLEM